MNFKTKTIVLALRTLATIPGKFIAQLSLEARVHSSPTQVGLHQNEGKINEPNNYYNLGRCHGFRAR